MKLVNGQKIEADSILTNVIGKAQEVAQTVAIENVQSEAAVVTADLTEYAGVQYAAPAAATVTDNEKMINVEVYIDTLHIGHTLTMEGQGWAQGWTTDCFAQSTTVLFDDPEFGASFDGTVNELLDIMNIHDTQQFTAQCNYAFNGTIDNGVHVAESFSAQRTVEVYKGEVTK